MRPSKFFTAISAIVLLAACAQPGEDSPDQPVRPALFNVTAPTHEPNLTVGPDASVYLSWIEDDAKGNGHHLRFASLADTGWTTPVTIASGDNWFVNWADVPSLHVGDSSMTAHWLEKNGESSYSYGVRVSHSRDGGDTWSPPRWLHDDNSPSEHGFVSFAQSGEQVAAVWLDGRKYARGQKEMTLRTRFIHADGTMASEAVLDDRVCDCCPVSAAATPDGRILVAYRDRSEGEIRDIATAYFDGTAWHEPTIVHNDNWMIAGCPVNGPAIDISDDTAGIAWFTAADDTSGVYYVTGPINGQSFSNPLQIDLGNPVGRVDVVLLANNNALVVWIENAAESGNANVLARRVSADGLSAPVTISEISSGRGSGFPRMVVSGQQVVFAWTQSSDTRSIATSIIPVDRFN